MRLPYCGCRRYRRRRLHPRGDDTDTLRWGSASLRPMGVTGINHIATMTTDLERHAKFYGDVFGAKVTFQMDAAPGHPRLWNLDLGGGSALNVFEVDEADIVGDRTRQGGRGAIDHFGIGVDSLAELQQVRERLVGAGVDVGEIQDLGGEWSLFFRDIDGMELEVCAPMES